LLEKNFHVIGIDSLTDYYSVNIKKKNMENLLKSKNFEFKKVDLVEADLKKIFSDVDLIFHVAAQPGVRFSWGENFKIYSRNNIETTQRLLETCVNCEIKKFVFTSSSSVYGTLTTVMKEDSPTRPISPYGVTKLAAEKLCYIYNKNYGVPSIVLRYFTVYGPRQRPDMSINKFVKKIFSGETIVIFGDGNQTRDFTFISDIIDGTLLAAESKFTNEIFNIGGGRTISVNDLVVLLEKIIGKKTTIEYKEKQKGEMNKTLADISKAKKLLNWQPKIRTEEGLKEYVNWYRREIYGKT